MNTLLTLLDRVQDGVLVATTNRRELLDPALLRRFDVEIEFPAPTPELLELLVAKLCSEYGVARELVGATNWEHFDAATKAVVRVARAEALREYEAKAQLGAA